MEGVGPGTMLGGRYTAVARVDMVDGAERWQGEEPELARAVSILCLPVDDARAAALLDAARVAAGLDIPACTRILDIGHEGPVAYVVEESLDHATSVTDLVRSGGLPGDEVRRIAGEVATALEGARARGVHHLRLSPDEVFRTPEGTIKVRGLATAAALAGVDEGGDRGARTDALGVVALTYAGLTGLWPVAGVPSGLDAAPQAFGGVAAPSEIASGVPFDLDALCRLALAGRGGPTSPGDFARQVAPWSSRPILGRPSLARASESTTSSTTGSTAPSPSPADPAAGPVPISGQPSGAAETATAIGPPAESVGSTQPAPAARSATSGSVDADTGAGSPMAPPAAWSAAQAAPAATAPDPTGPATGPAAAAGAGAAVGAALAGAGSAVQGALASAGSALSGLTAKLRPAQGTPARATDPSPTAPGASGPGQAQDGTPRSAAAVDVAGLAPSTPGSVATGAADGAPDGAPAGPEVSSTPARSAADPRALEPPMPGVPVEPLSKNDSRLALAIVAGFVLFALLVGINGVRKIGSQTDLDFGSGVVAATSAPPVTAAPEGPKALAVLSADGFDPLGDNSENGQLAAKVFDGNPETEWISEGYQTPNLGGLKPGVGVVLDLGPNVTPKVVKLNLKIPADLTVLVASNRSLDGAVTAGSLTGATGDVQVDVPADAGARQYVIVWFTNLTRDGDGFFRARLGEVSVLG